MRAHDVVPDVFLVTPAPKIRLARRFRKQANAPERTAWAALRQFRAQGFPVRRQHPIGPYVVDFAIMKARLVIEIDGGIHNRENVREKDANRESELRKAGWDILRVDSDTALSADHLIEIVSERLGIRN